MKPEPVALQNQLKPAKLRLHFLLPCTANRRLLPTNRREAGRRRPGRIQNAVDNQTVRYQQHLVEEEAAEPGRKNAAFLQEATDRPVKLQFAGGNSRNASIRIYWRKIRPLTWTLQITLIFLFLSSLSCRSLFSPSSAEGRKDKTGSRRHAAYSAIVNEQRPEQRPIQKEKPTSTQTLRY